MKEKNFKRKQALAKARDMRNLRKALRDDIASFMVRSSMLMCMNPTHDLCRVYGDGFKGFYNMRGRELKNKFDDFYRALRDPEGRQSIHSYVTRCYGITHRQPEELYQERNPTKVLENLTLQSDALMTRLIELAFDLEFEG